MDALREGRISGNDYIESSFEVDEAANRAADMQQEAERQVRYSSSSGQSARAAGEFAAEVATPYGTYLDIKDTVQLWGEGRYLAASGMTLLTAVSVIPGVRLLRKADDVADVVRSTDRAGDAAGSANRGGTSSSNEGLRVEQNSTNMEGGGHNQLLPGEGDVAPYRVLQAAGTKGDNITPHHIPSASHMANHGVNRKDGISINMEQPTPGVGGRHRRTFTYGTRADSGMMPRDALAAGVRDARRIYQQDGLYDSYIRRQLQELVRQNKTTHPIIFRRGR